MTNHPYCSVVYVLTIRIMQRSILGLRLYIWCQDWCRIVLWNIVCFDLDRRPFCQGSNLAFQYCIRHELIMHLFPTNSSLDIWDQVNSIIYSQTFKKESSMIAQLSTATYLQCLSFQNHSSMEHWQAINHSMHPNIPNTTPVHSPVCIATEAEHFVQLK